MENHGRGARGCRSLLEVITRCLFVLSQNLTMKYFTFRVYQQLDNFDDNAFAWFANFHNSRPGDPLWDKGMVRTFSAIETFEEDVSSGNLPQVSWIIAPTHWSDYQLNDPLKNVIG